MDHSMENTRPSFLQIFEPLGINLEPWKPVLDWCESVLGWYVDELKPYKDFILEIDKLEPDGIISGFLFFVCCTRFNAKIESKRYCFLFSLLYILVDHSLDNDKTSSSELLDLMRNKTSTKPLLQTIYNIYDEMNAIYPEGKVELINCFMSEAFPTGSKLEQAFKKGSSIVRVLSDSTLDHITGAVIQFLDDMIDDEKYITGDIYVSIEILIRLLPDGFGSLLFLVFKMIKYNKQFLKDRLHELQIYICSLL